MNLTVTNGYMQTKGKYIINDQGNNEYWFFLNVYSSEQEESNPIPFRAIGKTADWMFANTAIGDYVEVVGELLRPTKEKMFVQVIKPTIKKPRLNAEYTIRSTEILELFNPETIIERVNGKNAKKG